MSDHFKVGDREIKMSFGLLDELTRIIGDVDGLADLPVNPDVRSEVLYSVLIERDEKGQKSKEAPDLYNLEPSMVAELIEWVGEHVADFFLNAMGRTTKLLTKREDQFKALTPSSDGGEA